MKTWCPNRKTTLDRIQEQYGLPYNVTLTAVCKHLCQEAQAAKTSV